VEGTLVSHYRILAKAGAGGMATVYLAEDLKHGRRVALKVLHPDLAAAVGSERFLAEIRATATLQHPNILPLFDSGEANGMVFYVMPFVEGESLRERLARDRQLPLDEAVRLAQLVAGALDHAHRHGIIHRDIKPENILLSEGLPLVADFGVALAVSTAGGPRLTQSGLAVGTPLYMSPEQAAGDHEVDRRTDIYSLAAVLYEMLAGEPPFTGATAAAVTAKKMLESVPPLRTVRDTVPGALDAVIRKGLARTPADRYATAQQFADALELARSLSGATAVEDLVSHAPARDASRRRLVPWLLGTAAVVVAVAATSWLTAAWIRSRGGWDTPPSVTFPLPVEPLAVTNHGPAPVLAFSPDGGTLAYVSGPGGDGQLYLSRLDGHPATAVSGVTRAMGPFFSPDGKWIGYADAADSMLKKVPVIGGAAVPLAKVEDYHGGSWSRVGTIAFSGAEKSGGIGIWRVPEDGGAPQMVITTDSASQKLPWLTFPSFLPDGRSLLYAAVGGNAIALNVSVLDIETGVHHVVLDKGGWARYVAPGYLVYAQDGVLYGVRFDAAKAQVTGTPVPLRRDIMMNLPYEFGLGHFDVSPTGTLTYLGGPSYHESGDGLAWADREGRLTPLPDLGLPNGWGRGINCVFHVSPDGRRLLGNSPNGTVSSRSGWPESALFLYDLDRGSLTRLAPENMSSWFALWMPDGRRMVELMVEDSSQGAGLPPGNLFLRRIDGMGSVERLTKVPPARIAIPWSITADGSQVFYFEHDGTRNQADIWMVPTSGGQAPQKIFSRPGVNETDPAISPDGSWLAYVTDESGRDEIYLTDFPRLTQRWQVSSGGGAHPAWTRNGRELVFTQAADFLTAFGLWSVPVTPGAANPLGKQRLLFRNAGLYTQRVGTPFDPSPDGNRFLVLRKRPVDQAAVSHLTVVVNWTGELQAAVR